MPFTVKYSVDQWSLFTNLQFETSYLTRWHSQWQKPLFPVGRFYLNHFQASKSFKSILLICSWAVQIILGLLRVKKNKFWWKLLKQHKKCILTFSYNLPNKNLPFGSLQFITLITAISSISCEPETNCKIKFVTIINC